MKPSPLFNVLCTVILCFYVPVTVQAGQIITSTDREWVKQAAASNSPAEVSSSKSIVVLNFRNLTGQKRLDALQKGLTLLLTNDLAKIDAVTVVDRTRMQAMLTEVHPGAGDVIDNSSVPAIGKPLRAYYAVNGTISEGSIEQLEVNMSLIDVPFGNVTALPKATGSINELYRLQKELLFHIIDGLNIYLSSTQRRSLEVPASASTPALLAFFLGIDASDHGTYRQAAEFYNRALAEDPSLDLAKSALQELNDSNLLSAADTVPPVTEPEPLPPPVDQEMSTGMKIGIGVAAVAGGVALLAAAGGGGSSSSGDTSTPEEEGPTATIDTTAVDCLSDNVIISFSESMDTRFGYVSSTVSSFDVTGTWLDVQHYRVSWSDLEVYCDESPASADVVLNNFQSEEGTKLDGQASFTVTFND